MSFSMPAVKSLAAMRFGRRTIYLVPLWSVAYGAISVAVLFVFLVLIDRLVLGSLERGGWTSGELWTRYNKLVEENHRQKTTTKEGELRQWRGQPLPAAAGRRTILILGDSFVWGPPYTSLNHLWWQQLAIELERRGYHDVDVVAAGQPGWSTRQQLECAKRLVPEIKPDFVIWGYVTNDADEKQVKQIFDAQDQPPYGQRIRRQLKRVLPNLVFKFEALRADKLTEQYTGPEYGYAYPDWELKLLEGENFERHRRTIAEVADFLREADVPAVLLTLPHFPNRDYFAPRYGPVLKEWQAAGVAVKSTIEEFVGRYGSVPATGPDSMRWGINPSDSHPGPRATHFHAAMAADFLEQNWPEVLGAKDEAPPHELAINDWLPFDLNVRKTGLDTFEFDYPATTEFMPRRPGEEPMAMVALRYPLPLEEVRLDGAGVRYSRAWVSTLDPDEWFDEDRWRELERVPGSVNRFVLPAALEGRSVSMIRFEVRRTGEERQVQLTLVRPAEERR